MTAFLESVRSKINKDCLISGRLRKAGCTVVMADAPQPRLVIDFDKPDSPLPQDDRLRPDYLMIAAGKEGQQGWVVVLELKKGQLNADKVISQLRAGASVAENLVPASEGIQFYPVTVSGSIKKYERDKLKAKRVEFYQHKNPIRWISCGERLTEALRK